MLDAVVACSLAGCGMIAGSSFGMIEDDAAIAIETVRRQQCAVGQDDRQRGDGDDGRQRAVVALQVVADELHRQVHGPAVLVDVIDILLDHLGALHLVHARQYPLFGGGSLVMVDSSWSALALSE